MRGVDTAAHDHEMKCAASFRGSPTRGNLWRRLRLASTRGSRLDGADAMFAAPRSDGADKFRPYVLGLQAPQELGINNRRSPVGEGPCPSPYTMHIHVLQRQKAIPHTAAPLIATHMGRDRVPPLRGFALSPAERAQQCEAPTSRSSRTSQRQLRQL